MCLKFMRHACIAGSSMLHLPLYYVRLTELLQEIVIERATYVLGLERRLLMSLPSFAEQPAPTAKGRNRLQMTPYSAPLTAVSIKIITRAESSKYLIFCVLFSGFCDKWRKLTCLKYRAGHIQYYLTALVVVVAALVLG